MAAADEPLRYIRRYLLLDETMQEAQQLDHKSGNSQEPHAAQAQTASPSDPLDYDDELLVRD